MDKLSHAREAPMLATRSRDTRKVEAFRARVGEVVHRHPVVVDNAYTRWFATGQATAADIRHLTVQFSVFSHLFVEAQLRKVVNAPDLESYRAGKEILMNELGVAFSGAADDEGVATEGTVDGSRFRFTAAHFEWLLRFARPLGLECVDHLDWCVGNARAFAGFLASAFGFRVTAYAGPETGIADRTSYVVEQGELRFVVTSTLVPDSALAEHHRRHGDGVRDVAFTAAGAAAAYDAALSRGAVGLVAPTIGEDEGGRLVRATVATYGETQHSFV